MPAALRKASSNRDPVRQLINKQITEASLGLATFTERQLISYKTVIQDSIRQLEDLDKIYLELLPNNDDAEGLIYDAEVNACSDFRTRAMQCIGDIEAELIVKQRAVANAAAGIQGSPQSGISNSNSTHVCKTRIKVPELSLPKFSGKETEDYAKFIENLEQFFDQQELKPIEKFLQLKNCLEGNALSTISALPECGDSWDDACQILEKYFLNTERNKYKLLDSFNKLRFDYSENIFTFFSKIDHLTFAIDRSDIDLKYVLQYFIWKGFNQQMRNVYINMTNEPYPDLDTLTSKRDKAIALYELEQSNFERRKKFREKNSNSNNRYRTKSNQAAEGGYAANVPESKGKKTKSAVTWCILCKGTQHDNNHKIYKCPNYITSSKKIARLIEQKACVRCGFGNHVEKNCNFIFSIKCKYCNASHFPWLCSVNESAKLLVGQEQEEENVAIEDEESDSLSEPESESELLFEESAKMCSVKVNKMCLPSNAILPTFQGKVNGITCRGLKDSGCQKFL